MRNLLNNIFGNRRPGGSKKRVQEEMGWTKNYQTTKTGWRTVPNPEVGTARRARRSKIVLAAILAALPISLLSCLVAITAANNQPEPEPVIASTPQPTAWVPKGVGKAETIVWEWMRQTGRQPINVSSTDQQLHQCGNATCEKHTLIARWGNNDQLTIGLMLNPENSAIRSGPWIEPSTSSYYNNPLGGDPRTRQTKINETRALWDQDIRDLMDEWAEAWVSGNQAALLDISRLTTSNEFHISEPGWAYMQGTIRPVENVEPVIADNNPAHRWEVAALDLRPLTCPADEETNQCQPFTQLVEVKIVGGGDTIPIILDSRLPGDPLPTPPPETQSTP